ncbi:MAG: hypothetical protein ATN33_06685 [Epulopiscium sp. Nele67-Bin001]|nr:MAG: hypothetical protein ATN33_06685 [Epulopiscium sp. Nele67-Bin001]
MRERTEEILILLNNSELTLDGLQAKYTLSERTIKNDIAEINEFLSYNNLPKIYITSTGTIKFTESINTSLLSDALKGLDIYTYKLNSTQRSLYIQIFMLWHNTNLTMKDFATQLEVSRITILNDFNIAKEKLEQHGVAVISETGRGIYVNCYTTKRIKLLVHLLIPFINLADKRFFSKYLLEKLNIAYNFGEIYLLTKIFLNEKRLMAPESAIYHISVYIFILINTSHLNTEDCPATFNYTQIEDLVFYIENKLQIVLSKSFPKMFRHYLYSTELILVIRTIDKLELYQIVTYFLYNIDQEFNLLLHKDTLLIQALVLHLHNIKSWDELEFDFLDIKELAFNYDILLEAVNSKIYIIEKYLLCATSEIVKNSIIIHIYTSIMRLNKHLAKCSVIIVCPGSTALSKYLEMQIKNYFDFNIVGVYSTNDIKYQLVALPKIDFILSVVELGNIDIRYLKLSPKLTIQDMIAIQKISLEFQVQHYITTNVTAISNTNDFLNSNKTGIGQLLKKEHIIFDSSTSRWEDNIKLAGQILLDRQYITQQFIDKSILNVKEYGDYIILGQNVAIAHASKDNGVYQDGLSLLISHQGIVFSGGDRLVNFLFFFATTGEVEYIELLDEIVEIGMREAYQNSLLQMDVEQVYKTLCYK